MRISDWSSDVCSSDLLLRLEHRRSRDLHFRIEMRRAMLERLETADRRAELLALLQIADRQIHRAAADARSEEHTSELQSLMRISYAVFCLKKKKNKTQQTSSKRQIYQSETTTIENS